MERTAGENCISVLLAQGAQTYFSVPLIYGGQVVGVIVPAHVVSSAFSEEETGMWQDCAEQVSVAVECLLKSQESQSLRDQIAGEKIAAPYVMRHRDTFSELVGDSPVLKSVFSQVELGCSHRFFGPHRGRNRHRQGPPRSGHTQPQQPQKPALRRDELRHHSVHVARE
jgi:hypothetical protein